MKRVVFGDKNVGVQGIYYFDDDTFVEKFAAKIKPFLDSLRCRTNDYWKQFMQEWENEPLLYNFLIECKSRVEVELETPEVWWEPGGSLYGEKWHNVELPNGCGQCYCGDKLIEENDDSEEPKDKTASLRLCLYKLAHAGVATPEETDEIMKRIEQIDAQNELSEKLHNDEDTDEITQAIIKFNKEWDDLPQEDKDKIINAFSKLPD